MISFDLVATAYRAGLIRVMDNPLRFVICGHEFYFGGNEGETMTAEEYTGSIPEDDIVRKFSDVLSLYREVPAVYRDVERYLKRELKQEEPGLRGITDFSVRFDLNGRRYVFFADTIRRDLTDGGGNPILTAKVWNIDENIRGVANLSPDWRIVSLYMEQEAAQ